MILGSEAMGSTMKRSTALVLSVLHLVMLVASQTLAPTPSPTTLSPQIIDTHCHYVPPFYRELLASRNITAGGSAIPDWNASAHLALNAEFGIVTSVVSVSTPGAKLSKDAPIEEGRTLARQINEYGYNLTKEYPKTFLFWATLTLPDLDGAVAEAIYALDTLGAAGVIIEANAYGELIGTPRYAPLYKVLDDRKAVVFIHPSNSPCAEDTANSTDFPPSIVDFLLDTSRAAMNLVYRNVTKDYPNIKFILAHSGGFIPFAATRAADGLAALSRNGQAALATKYYEEISEFHVDLAASATKTALPSTTAYFNNTQITFGSDYPYVPVVGIVQNVDGLAAFHFHDYDRRRIHYINAYRLFKKFLK